jgi:hypothetical protein
MAVRHRRPSIEPKKKGMGLETIDISVECNVQLRVT